MANLIHSNIITFIFGVIFLYSSLVINFIQALLYCGLRPFSKHLYRNINYYLFKACFCQLIFLAVWLSSVDIIIYLQGDMKEYFGKETGFLISNHHYDIDWLIAFTTYEYFDLLGALKNYLKTSTKYFPTFGWNFFFGENIFVSRNSGQCQQSLVNKLNDILEYKYPQLIVLYPEGTRFTEEKWHASRKFAEERGLPFFKHHLLPRTLGFTTSMTCFPGKIKAIYNFHMCCKRGEKPTLKDILFGKKIQVHVYFERFPFDQVPTGEEASKDWLYKLFQRKDRLAASFYETGDFFEKSGIERVEGMHLPRSYFSLFNEIGWAIVVLSSFTYGVFLLFKLGFYTYLGLLPIALYISYQFLSKAIDVTDTSKGSTYGLSSSTENGKSKCYRL